jgi:hypothetical protein
VIFERCTVIGTSGFDFGVESAEEDSFTVNPDGGIPSACPFVKRDADEARRSF